MTDPVKPAYEVGELASVNGERCWVLAVFEDRHGRSWYAVEPDRDDEVPFACRAFRLRKLQREVVS